MGVTRVTGTRSGTGAVKYVLNPKVKNKERVLAVSGSNVSTEFASDQMAMTRKMYEKDGVNSRNGKKFMQGYRIIQSFSDKELDPNKPEDIEKCNAIGYELAREAYADHEVLVVTHGDGVGGKLHNHLIVNATSFETGKQLRGERTKWQWIAEKSDEVLKRNGIEPIQRKDHAVKPRTQAEIRLASEDKYVWKDDLRGRLNEAFEDERSIDKESFKTVLDEEYGITTKKWTDTGKHITYEFEDENGTKRKARSTSLGESYTRENVESLLLENNDVLQANVAVAAVAPETVKEEKPTSDFDLLYSSVMSDMFTGNWTERNAEKVKEKEEREKREQENKSKLLAEQKKAIAEQKAEAERQKREAKDKRERESKEQAEEARKQQEALLKQQKIEAVAKQRREFMDRMKTDSKNIIPNLVQIKKGSIDPSNYKQVGVKDMRTNIILPKHEERWYNEFKAEQKRAKQKTNAVKTQSKELEL